MSLTPGQKRVMLKLCNAAETGCKAVYLTYETGMNNPIRETATGCALVRKGLARPGWSLRGHG
ncbi:MAG: hypothetical protein V3S71_02805 [Acidobacteriota bacterium]